MKLVTIYIPADFIHENFNSCSSPFVKVADDVASDYLYMYIEDR